MQLYDNICILIIPTNIIIELKLIKNIMSLLSRIFSY